MRENTEIKEEPPTLEEVPLIEDDFFANSLEESINKLNQFEQDNCAENFTGRARDQLKRLVPTSSRSSSTSSRASRQSPGHTKSGRPKSRSSSNSRIKILSFHQAITFKKYKPDMDTPRIEPKEFDLANRLFGESRAIKLGFHANKSPGTVL